MLGILTVITIIAGLAFVGILMFSSSIMAFIVSAMVFCLAALILMICACDDGKGHEA